jgi:hypothetical protein
MFSVIDRISANSIQYYASWITLSNVLSFVTLVVLIFTAWAAIRQATAARRQAEAAEKLTEATHRQIETSQVQADAAADLQRLTRRQLEEALRPILLLKAEGGGSTEFETTVVNDGSGPALDIKCFYGTTPSDQPNQLGMLPSIMGAKATHTFRYQRQRAQAEGLRIEYRSLTGAANATLMTWSGGVMQTSYVPDWEAKKNTKGVADSLRSYWPPGEE